MSESQFRRKLSLRAVSLFALLFYTRPASGHSWNEQLSVIDSKGHFTGPQGYPRGYKARTDPDYTADSMTYLIPALSTGRTRIDSSDLLCHPNQRTPNQGSKYPRLQVAPGSAVAMKYLENGHVSLPQNQPGKGTKGGTVFVFGTESPQPNEKLVDVLQWNKDGTGGNKQGVLLGSNNYDDDRCHQINSGTISQQRVQKYPDPVQGQPGTTSELWCETDVVMPKSLKPGSTYTVYWIWQWPTQPGLDPGIPSGKDEYYTTCNDFDVVKQTKKGKITNTLPQQDPMRSAHDDFKSRTAIVDDPLAVYKDINIPGLNRGPSSGAASSTDESTATKSQQGSSAPSGHIVVPPINGVHAQADEPTPNVATAVVTVTATIPPGKSIFVQQGIYTVTFTDPMATLNARDVEHLQHGAMHAQRRQRFARRRSQPDLPQLPHADPPAVTAWGA